jgi:hypothetical protein
MSKKKRSNKFADTLKVAGLLLVIFALIGVGITHFQPAELLGKLIVGSFLGILALGLDFTPPSCDGGAYAEPM